MTAHASKTPQTATRLLRREHAHVMTQLHKLEPDTPASARSALLRSICAELEIHAQIEEELFYPALRAASVLAPALDKSVPEHDAMRRLIQRLRGLEGRPAAQDDALHELMNTVLHHVADEETQLLPAAERFLGPARLAELGTQMAARRRELAQARAEELLDDTVSAVSAKAWFIAGALLLAGAMLVRALRRRPASA